MTDFNVACFDKFLLFFSRQILGCIMKDRYRNGNPPKSENAAHTPSRLHTVLGAFCLSQFTHKRTLPTKPFSCQRDRQGLYIRHEYSHSPFRPPRLEPERKGRFQVLFGGKFCYQFYFVMKSVIKWNFRAAMPPLPWLKKHQAS